MAMPAMGLLAWLDKKIVDPLYQILRRGLEPKQLAFSTALGIALGIFPICGVTVLLCGLAIALLGSLCHAPTVLLANFITTPIELSLVVPLLRFGEVISGGPPFPLTSDALKKVLTGQASREVILSIAHALLGWLVAAPFILAALYIIFLPCFKVLVHKFSTVPSSPNKPSNSLTEIKLKNGVVRVVEPYKGSPSPFVGLVAFLPLYSLGILMTCLVIAFSFASGNKCFVYPITNSLDRVPICLFIVLSSLWFRF